MSNRKEIIELSAPSRLGKAEKFVSRVQPCSYCRGEGSFTGDNPNGERDVCPDCGGSGKVQAVVNVTWVPVGEASLKLGTETKTAAGCRSSRISAAGCRSSMKEKDGNTELL